MRLLSLQRRPYKKNYHKYLINWDKKEASKFQTDVKNFLYPYLKFHIVYSEFPIPRTMVNGRMRIDIFDATTLIAYEIMGIQHGQYTPFFHGNPAHYLAQIKRDVKKAEFCEINNIKLIEINPEDMPLSPKFFKEKFDIIL